MPIPLHELRNIREGHADTIAVLVVVLVVFGSAVTFLAWQYVKSLPVGTFAPFLESVKEWMASRRSQVADSEEASRKSNSLSGKSSKLAILPLPNYNNVHPHDEETVEHQRLSFSYTNNSSISRTHRINSLNSTFRTGPLGSFVHTQPPSTTSPEVEKIPSFYPVGMNRNVGDFSQVVAFPPETEPESHPAQIRSLNSFRLSAELSITGKHLSPINESNSVSAEASVMSRSSRISQQPPLNKVSDDLQASAIQTAVATSINRTGDSALECQENYFRPPLAVVDPSASSINEFKDTLVTPGDSSQHHALLEKSEELREPEREGAEENDEDNNEDDDADTYNETFLDIELPDESFYLFHNNTTINQPQSNYAESPQLDEEQQKRREIHESDNDDNDSTAHNSIALDEP